MAGKDGAAPIIIINKKVVAGGHHGGAWKVAYADFVTAMMAFFMVMWLITQMPEEKLAGISEYFLKTSPFAGTSPTPTKGSLGDGGAGDSPVEIFNNVAPEQGEGEAKETGQEQTEEAAETTNTEAREPTEEEIQAEAQKLDELMEEVKQAIETSESLAEFKEQLLLDITSEGLRIQIVDRQNRPMFDKSSFRLQAYTLEILRELSPYMNQAPNRISISGHTDVTPFAGGDAGYSNWELSADRANAARRALIVGGMNPSKIARVIGSADTALFNRDDPTDPINRRISIIIMNTRAERAALDDGGPDQTDEFIGTDGAATDASAETGGESGDEAPADAQDDQAAATPPPGLPTTAVTAASSY